MKATLQRVIAPKSEGGSYKLTFTTETGDQHSGVYGRPQYVTAPFEVGHEAELAIESKKGDDGGEFWVLKQWGEPKAQPQKSSGGGGGFRGAPKSSAEIFSSCIAGIMKSAIEQGWDVKTVAPFLDEFEARMARLA